MTEIALEGHIPVEEQSLSSLPTVASRPRLEEPSASRADLSFDVVYDQEFDFVWRCVRRLGAHPAVVDDLVQEVFIAAHRRLGDFEARSSVRTWLFGITRRIVSNHRRSNRRRGHHESRVEEIEASDGTPESCAARAEAVRLLHALLDQLDDEKREVFILAELEEMSAPEIAVAISANLNTVYSRLRLAREAFNAAVARHRAHREWKER